MQGKPFRGVQVNRSHPLARGLVACYLINEGGGGKIYDISGYANHGTFVGTAAWSSSLGGHAVDFPDDSDPTVAYITAPNVPWLTCATAITIHALVDTDAAPDAGDYAPVARKRFGPADSWMLAIDASDHVDMWVDTGSPVDIAGTTAISGLDVAAITGTWDAANIRVYVGGIEENSGAQTGSMAAETDAMEMGGTTGSTAYYDTLDGRLIYLTIWNRCLSAAEVAWLAREPYAMIGMVDYRLFYVVAAPTFIPRIMVI